MYIPTAYKVTDDDTIWSFICEHSFGILITPTDRGVQATHLPFLPLRNASKNGILRGHMAMANPQVKDLESNGEVLAIFSGPNGYISPGWYSAPRARSVPTWNYTAVHVYGAARIINQTELIDTLRASTEAMERGRRDPWSYDELEPDLASALTKAISGFEIEVSRVEAKFKLGQNRSEADINQVRNHLLESEFASDTQLANLMGSLNTNSGHRE